MGTKSLTHFGAARVVIVVVSVELRVDFHLHGRVVAGEGCRIHVERLVGQLVATLHGLVHCGGMGKKYQVGLHAYTHPLAAFWRPMIRSETYDFLRLPLRFSPIFHVRLSI